MFCSTWFVGNWPLVRESPGLNRYTRNTHRSVPTQWRTMCFDPVKWLMGRSPPRVRPELECSSSGRVRGRLSTLIRLPASNFPPAYLEKRYISDLPWPTKISNKLQTICIIDVWPKWVETTRASVSRRWEFVGKQLQIVNKFSRETVISWTLQQRFAIERYKLYKLIDTCIFS